MTFEFLQKQLDAVQELSERLNGKQEYEYDITFFGGEPLLELENIFLFEEYIGKKLNVVHKFIQTNGMLLNSEVKERLDSRNINIGISCDGCNDHNHRAIEKLYEEHVVYMHPKMMVSGYNVKDLMTNVKYFFDIAFRTNQQNFYLDASYVKDDVWSEQSLKELKSQLTKLNEFILWVYETYHYYLKIGFYDRVMQNIKQGKRDFVCFAGKTGFSLTPSGIIYPCSRFYSDDLFPLYDSNENIWYDTNIKAVSLQNTTDNQKCQECPIGKYCNQGCYLSQLKNGGLIDGYCEVQRITFHMVTELYKTMKNKYNTNVM